MNEIPTTIKNKALVEQKREQIVLAAIKLFSQKGFHKTTLRELSEESKISYGNIYDYVGNKNNIFYLIHEYLCEKAFYQLEWAMKEVEDPVEKLRRMVKAEFYLMDQWSDGILLLYQEGHALEKPYSNTFLKKEHEHIQMFERVIEQCIREGKFLECNPRLAANLIKTSIDGWVLKRWDLRGVVSSSEAESFILDTVLRGLLTGTDSSAKEQHGLKKLSGKRALVVGGNTVLGAAVCETLASQGAQICTYLAASPFRVEKSTGAKSNLSKNIRVYSEEQHGRLGRDLYLRICEEFGGIDIFVQDLGVGILEHSSPNSSTQNSQSPAESLEKNFLCAQDLSEVLIEQMGGRSWGRIIYLTPWAWDQYVDLIRYNTITAGTVALAETLSEALASSPISVNCVIPGYLKTPRPSELQKAKTEEVSHQMFAKQCGKVSDVTNVVLYLAGDDSGCLTKQVLRINSG